MLWLSMADSFDPNPLPVVSPIALWFTCHPIWYKHWYIMIKKLVSHILQHDEDTARMRIALNLLLGDFNEVRNRVIHHAATFWQMVKKYQSTL